MYNFEYKKSKIISVNVIDFKKRHFILDERIIGSDQGIIATFEDGNNEMLFIDCMYPLNLYSSESIDTIDPIYQVSYIVSIYEENFENPLILLKKDFINLGIDLSLIDDIFKK